MPKSATPRNRDAERRALRLRQVAVFAWYSDAWPPACECCGATGNLSIDHANGDGPAQRAEALGLPGKTGYNPSALYLWIITNGFPDGFQVLDKPCNSSKRAGDRCRLYHGELGEHERWCTGCEQIRDKRTDFTRHPRTKDGLNAHCRECSARHIAAWRERNGTERVVSTRPGTVGGRLLAYLDEHGPTQVGVIAEALDMRPVMASKDLSGLLKDGHVARPAHGVYCLPGHEGRLAQLERVYTPGPGGRAAMNGRDWAAGTTWTTTDVT